MSDESVKKETEEELETRVEEGETPETAAEAVEETEGGDVELKLAEAEAKAEEHWDQLLRTRAEMDNLHRRVERDLENAHKFALEKFARELLPVKDSLELGLSAVAESEDSEHMAKLKEGTQLTLKMLSSAMEKFGISEVNPVDEPFNPEFHQAMSMLETPDRQPNTVVNVMQKGYVLNERLIRPAMVVVSKAAENTDKKVDEKA